MLLYLILKTTIRPMMTTEPIIIHRHDPLVGHLLIKKSLESDVYHNN